MPRHDPGPSGGSIAIITISKDDPPGLERTLASIASQIREPYELALVRAGHSCGTLPHLVQAAKAHEIADPGLGISAAFNAAIAACRSEWLVFLNGGDSLAHRDSLLRIRAACAAEADRDIVAFRALTSDGTTLPRRSPRGLCDYLYIAHQASAFRRTLFDTIGLYSDSFRIRMDLDWMARYLLRRGSGRIALVDEVVANYRLDGISSTSLLAFHAEELRVLTRSPRFTPALIDFALRRMPGGLARNAWRRMNALR